MIRILAVLLITSGFVIALEAISFNEAVAIAKCMLGCFDEKCRNACEADPGTFDVLDSLAVPQTLEKSNANITLHCRDTDILMLHVNRGVYIVDRSTDNFSWTDTKVVTQEFVTFGNLTMGTEYSFRAHRLTRLGISLSEISPFFHTFQKDYIPQQVKNISLVSLRRSPYGSGNLRATIKFEPAEDHACYYDVLLWYGDINIFPHFLKRPEKFEVQLGYVEYDRNATVFLTPNNYGGSTTGTNVTLRFQTPNCLLSNRNLNVCAPNKVEGLRIADMRKKGETYDILVKWNQMEFLPESYTIKIVKKSGRIVIDSKTVFGNVTEVRFTNLNLSSEFEVHIFATSLGGKSQLAVIDNYGFLGSTEPTWSSGNFSYYTIPAVGLIIFFVALLIHFLYSRHQRYESLAFGSYEKTKQEREPSLLNGKSEEYPVVKDVYEINPKYLTIKDVIGSGAFGVVRLGALQNENGMTVDVAVKTVEDSSDPKALKIFEQEISMMKSAGHHPNIVCLVGYCVLEKRPLLITEYCHHGDLQTYLRAIWQLISWNSEHGEFYDRSYENCLSNPRSAIKNDINNPLYVVHPEVTSLVNQIKEDDLLDIARQIALGMEFLSLKRIVHRDLAARNILVCSDKSVKISDFGLSRDVYEEDIYRKEGDDKLPIKWMAIESLTHQVYTTSSDVWSFGILLWEIVTLGGTPYPSIPTSNILKLVVSGYRMKRPKNCGQELYKVMLACWVENPQLRPTFTALKKTMEDLLSSARMTSCLTMSYLNTP